jgi:hypothetical protein
MFIVEYDDTFVKGNDIEELRLELAIRIDFKEYIEDFDEMIKTIGGVVKIDTNNCQCVDLANKLNQSIIKEEDIDSFLSVEEADEELIALYCIDRGYEWQTQRDRDNYRIYQLEDYEDYCKELAIDCGYIGQKSYIFDYIDWARFAADCAREHDSFTFKGLDYIIERS